MANTANISSLSVAELNALIANTEPQSALTTDFNVTPYYDDYTEDKSFYRILYKPGYAVQARELTQQQTITQKQIDRFGRHMFREGSIVIPGQFGIELNTDYIKIKDVDNSNNAVNVTDFINQTITGLTNGITAYVIDVANGTENETDTKTLFVRYTSGSQSNTAIKTFVDGEILVADTEAPFNAVALSSGSVGKGSRFIIQEGVVFAKEHFISFPTSSIVLSRYQTTPTCRVGFEILEEIVSANEDTSLLDPALESSNYSAPGADRLKLTTTLKVLDINDNTGFPNFVELFTIDDGVITERYDRPQYNIVKDELAKRTMDESGDYYVNGLNVRVRENLLTNDNDGYSANGNSSLLSVGVEPGVAYVKGYETGIVGKTEYLTISKSATYQNVSSQIGTATMGDYITCNEYVGNIDHDKGTIISLRDAASLRISTAQGASVSGAGSVIGTARVLAVEYDSGLLGTAEGAVNIFLTDIRMTGSNSFSSVKSVSGTNFGADVILNADNNAVLKETASKTLLYFTGSNHTRTVRNSSGAGSMQFNFKRTVPVSISSAGVFSVSITTSGETFPYGALVSDLSNADRRDLILTLDNDVEIAGPNTVSANGTKTLTGTSTNFLRFNVGDKIRIAGNSTIFIVASRINGTTLTVTENLPTVSGAAYYKVYKNGDVIDLTSISFDNGEERSVSATTNTLSFNLKETFGGTGVTGKLTYQAVRANGASAVKTLNPNRLVKIDCSSAGTTGPFNLGFSDIYKINKIVRQANTMPTSLSVGEDVTSKFKLDNGQRDNLYDHGSIIPQGITLSTNDRLLVSLDYFTAGTYSGGKGFFSIDSYDIDDITPILPETKIRTENVPIFISPQSGNRYDLRNYIDFRPVKAPTATDATTANTASVNPAVSSNFSYDADGLRLIAPSTQYSHSYSFYESRRDLVVIDKDKNISIISSNPGQSPVTPSTPENTMALATIFVAPYPSLAPNYAQKINRKELAVSVTKVSNIRFTMKDIGVLKKRIENLEYYASLSLLEKAAMDLKILDENGLDRFKNGIFTDSFANHLLGDTNNRDYRIVVDPFEKSIRPAYTMHSHNYDYLNTSPTLVKTGDLITLPYTQSVLIDQPKVSSFRNVEYTSYRFEGRLSLFPETDIWVDTQYAPDEQISIGPDANNLPQIGLTTTWNAWQTSVTGYYLDSSVNRFGTTLPAQSLNQQQFNNLLSSSGGLIVTPNSPADQKVSELTTSTRTGSELYVSGVTEKVENVGSKVLDVSLIPYIRPQTIYVVAQGLKPNTKMFTFFDGEDMSAYVTQVSGVANVDPIDWNPSSNTNISSNSPISSQQPNLTTIIGKAEGDDLIVDANGAVFFALRLPPNKRFRVGTKEVKITDNPNNSSLDATCQAVSYFVSQGLTQQKQNTILTTREIVQSQREVTETISASKVIGYVDRPSCTAYSFIPKAPDGEEGVFLTSVDLYFAAKHPTLGVWIEVREMDNAGGITRNAVPLSEVWKTAAELNVSDDASAKTNFKFRSPIFLYSNVQYAFVIHTVGLNPDTYIWISRLGETDKKTGDKINARPLTGTYYTTNNNLNWDIVPDIDLLCTFYRASFTTNVVGQDVLGNRPFENLIINNASSAFTNYGEKVYARTKLTLTGNTSVINVGDYLIGQTSGANSAVISKSGTVVVANNKFVSGETVTIYGKPETSVISSLITPTGTLYNYTVTNGEQKIELISSNGKFAPNDIITGETSGDTATVVSIANVRYSVVDFEPTYLNFNKTNLGFEMQTTSNTGSLESYVKINDGSNYNFDTEKALFSNSFEGTNRSNNVKISMVTTTNYLSPVVDLSRTHSVYVDNLINADFTDESGNSSGGNLYNKYISQIITLAEGQDAEDLQVILTAYRPPNTDVKVYVKILQGEDGEQFNNQKWIELVKSDSAPYSSLSNRSDFKEFTFRFADSQLTGPFGEVQYTGTSGTLFTGFKYYQIKIGLVGTNSAIVPRVGDLRAIALQI